MPVFQRLIGLETEYALRYRSATLEGVRPAKFSLYKSLIAALQARLPLAPARHFKEGVFTATGGAVWFEAERPSAGGGLVEGATPECRGALQAVTYQRAQDRLLAEAAGTAAGEHELRLLKNSRDSRGNVYGSQENYEVRLAEGWRLHAWRLGLIALLPLVVLTWLAILLSILATLSYFLLAGVVYYLLRIFVFDARRVALALFGPDLYEGRETCVHIPVWLESLLQSATRVVTAPLAVALYLLIRWFAFRPYRRDLVPFLVSRSLVSGSGLVDGKGQFRLADKAMAINCVLGFGGLVGDRPLFNMGHLFKTVYAESWFHPARYADLFGQRQRLQIGLGDSNMAEVAEYLRVGTTLLVIDAIEQGAMPPVPRLRRPIPSLHQICSDPSLKQTVRSQCASWTALELQRFYWEACQRYLDEQVQVPEDARRVLRLWGQVLDGLESLRTGEPSADGLVGNLDWVTKKMVLDGVDATASWEVRKKIDIRYHELSPEGYFERLRAAGVGEAIVSEAEVERAMRIPPPYTPATRRGHYIREFSGGQETVAANWKRVIVGQGRRARVIPLHGEALRGALPGASPIRLKSPDDGCSL